MDELVAVHPFSTPGCITSSPDGQYAYFAEGAAVALIRADPGLPNAQQNYDTPIWRAQVASQGVTPIAMALDPEADWDETDDPNDLLLIAGGRDGLWVMEASESLSAPRAFRIDDSGNNLRPSQYGRKWCNDVELMQVDGVWYVLALFARVDHSNLRAYKLSDIRQIVASGSETGSELTPMIAFLDHNPNASGDAYAFGLAVDTVDATHATAYVAMGEQGLFRVRYHHSVSGNLAFAAPFGPSYPVEFGPFFGDGSAYADRVIANGRRLYGTVRYYEDGDPANPETFQHEPYFLDVAIEDFGAGHHRIYAALDHLGWCAFNLDAPWDEDIWTDNSPPSTAAPGYPDFIQEGKRYQILGSDPPLPPSAPQNHDQIRLLDDPTVPADKLQSFAKHVQVVATQEDAGADPVAALVVTLSNNRFVKEPGRMNEGRVLGWNLNLGHVEEDDYPAHAHGQYEYTLVYDLEHVGDNSQDPATQAPYWAYDEQNLVGMSVGGWDLHVPSVQPVGELHVFYGFAVKTRKVIEPGEGEKLNSTVRVMYTNWPDNVTYDQATGMGTHADWKSRGRFQRLSRLTIAYGPSLIDPNLMVTSTNDAHMVEDGPVLFDPVGKVFETPFAQPGFGFSPDPPLFVPSGRAIGLGQTYDLTYGELMNPLGGFLASTPQGTREYRMGFRYRYIGTGSDGDQKLPPRWLANRTAVSYAGGGSSGQISAVDIEEQIWMTPPASKFSPSPYPSTGSPGDIDDQVTWSGRPYYSVTTTFEGYNAHVQAYWAQHGVGDEDGYLFSNCNGSPQGVWVGAMSRVQFTTDNATAMDDLLHPGDYGSPGAGDRIFRGALLTHPEFWNVPDVRPGGADVHAENFLTSSGVTHQQKDIQNWHPDMFQVPIPGTQDLAWILAVPCGYVALNPNDLIFTEHGGAHSTWGPDPAFDQGYRHMMVRMFDMTDPSQVLDFVPNSTGSNGDSLSLPAFTLIGPDEETSAEFVKGIQIRDNLGTTRYLMLVADLSGNVYVYDVEGLLSLVGTATEPSGRPPHFGWEFKDSQILGAPYQTQRSLSDDHPNGVYGCEVVQEGIGANLVTYVYLGVPRIGIEVAKLYFDASNQAHLDYLGRIQTPGNGTSLFVREFAPGSYPFEKLLYLSDYDGGMRVFAHSAGGI